jgi:ElaB/YqjD/DUF883 family membrane-anchored ribosome-binding protein
MNQRQESEALVKAKVKAKCEAAAPTYRTVLIAACVGVVIGLLVRR